MRLDRIFHQKLANPVSMKNPKQILLETTGRKSGEPRQTPVGGKRVGQQFWMVSEHGDQSDYVRNLMAEPGVRLRLDGDWHHGVAHPLPQDDVRARLRTLPRGNSGVVRALGTNLLTIRIDLAD